MKGIPSMSMRIRGRSMMKTCVMLSLLFLSIVAAGNSAEKGRGPDVRISEISADLKIPPDWKKVGKNIYTLKNFNKTLEEWNRFLSEGHQPWRLEPKNTAAACLLDFGVSDNSHDIFKFADRLTEVKESEVYVLKAGKDDYDVFVRVGKTIPIAYKLVIMERRKPR